MLCVVFLSFFVCLEVGCRVLILLCDWGNLRGFINIYILYCMFCCISFLSSFYEGGGGVFLYFSYQLILNLY